MQHYLNDRIDIFYALAGQYHPTDPEAIIYQTRAMLAAKYLNRHLNRHKPIDADDEYPKGYPPCWK